MGRVIVQFDIWALWGQGKILGWGEFSRFLRFEVGDRSRFRFWHNVWCEDQTLKKLCQCCFLLLAIRRPQWRIMCSFLIIHFSRMSHSSDQCMIGRWSLSLFSLIFCTLSGWAKVVRRECVGSLSKGGVWGKIFLIFYHAISTPHPRWLFLNFTENLEK